LWNHRPNSLVGLFTLADCWIVGSLGDLSLILALWVFWLVVDISLIGFISLSLVGFIGLGFVGINSLISSLALSTRRLSFPINDFSAAIIAVAKLSAAVRKQATHGVVTAKSSVSKIANAAALYTFKRLPYKLQI
jgi:hypothetical protein